MSATCSRQSEAVEGVVDDINNFVEERVHKISSFDTVLLGNHLEFAGDHNGGINVRNLRVCQVHIVLEFSASPFLVVSPGYDGVSGFELASPGAIQIFRQNSFLSLALKNVERYSFIIVRSCGNSEVIACLD